MDPALYQVDAFTDTPFTGNPAAVCISPPTWNADWMQSVAEEMNLSETAFLKPVSDGTFELRWFTPSAEVDLCGHATLAAAHVLWEEGMLAPGTEAQFESKSGTLVARQETPWISMDFPADPPTPVEPPPQLLDALDLLDPLYVGRSSRDYLIRCKTQEAVHELDPEASALSTIDTRGVIVTALPADDNEDERTGPPDYVSRFFAPAVGIPEDPVTGSAHCTLGPYWTAELGETDLIGRQISARGGTVRTAVEHPDADRVTLSGQATTTLRGRLVA